MSAEIIMKKEMISTWFMELQDSICQGLEQGDGKAVFHEDVWERPEGGGGRTRVVSDGNLIEKGGVNFSAVFGSLPEFMKKDKELNYIKKSEDETFFATGISIVLHPQSPMVPIIHMNLRYFEINEDIRWFGGGIDLTPHYVVPEDASFFHQSLKNACDLHDLDYYPHFKVWADDYFFNKHRNETRGIGGIFFDRIMPGKKSIEDIFAFTQTIGSAFLPIYTHFLAKNSQIPYDKQQKDWQLLRRGRYAEFNLVYDKGTRFGLETNGRIESILMSLPPLAAWSYNTVPAAGSEEEYTLNHLKRDLNWLNY